MKKMGYGKNISVIIVAVLSLITVLLGGVFVVKFIRLSTNSGIEKQEVSINFMEETAEDTDNGLITSRDVKAGLFPGEILLRNEDMISKITQASWGGAETVSFEVNGGEEEDLIVLEFTAQNQSGAPVPIEILFNGDQKVTVEINDKKNNYYVPFYIKPGGRVMSLRLVYEEKKEEENGSERNEGESAARINDLSFGNFCVTDYGKECLLSSLKTGRYLAEEFTTEKAVWTKDALKGNAIVSDGEYLYLFRYGELVVYRNNSSSDYKGAITEDNLADSLTETGRLGGFGQVFSVRLYPDKKLLLACSRERGVYFVNINNPEKPVLYSHYETVSLCYGGDVYGDYAFLCNRFNGIEILDISDIRNPKYLTGIHSSKDSEYWNCEVNAGYLYTVAKGQNTLDVYDVRDLGKIMLLGSTLLDGEAEALEIKDDRIYIATAKNSTFQGSGMGGNVSFMTGSGNGLEVYDLSVSDPGKPKLTAREKIDGRTNRYPFDVWDIAIYGDYAYVSLMNGGLLVYDIKSNDGIKRKAAFHIVAEKSSEGFTELDPEECIMPYPVMEESHSAVIHTAVLDGEIYVISNTGLYRFPGPEEEFARAFRDENVLIQGSPKEKHFTEADGYEIDILSSAGTVYDVAALPDGNFTLACGEEGIRITDGDMNTIGLTNTGHSVKDLSVSDNTVYSAETDSLGVFHYEDGTLTETGRADNSAYNLTLSSLCVSEDGKTALVQGGYGRYCLADLSDSENPEFLKIQEEELGGMYGHNICTGALDGKVLGIAGALKAVWYEIRKDAEDTAGEEYDGNETAESSPEIKCFPDATELTINESNGYASLGNECIVMKEHGYMIYNPVTGEISTEYNSGQSGKTDENGFENIWGGKCIVSNNILVIVKCEKGEISAVDITDCKNPKVMMHIVTDFDVDLPAVAGEDIYVPIRHDGVMRIRKK